MNGIENLVVLGIVATGLIAVLEGFRKLWDAGRRGIGTLTAGHAMPDPWPAGWPPDPHPNDPEWPITFSAAASYDFHSWMMFNGRHSFAERDHEDGTPCHCGCEACR